MPAVFVTIERRSPPWGKLRLLSPRGRDLSRYRRPTGAAFAAGPLDRRSVVNGNILSSKGVQVGWVVGDEVFGLKMREALRS